MKEIVLIDGARTPFGTFGGALRDTSATDLGVIAAKGALERSKVDPKQIDQVIFGNVLQTSGDAVYLARHIGLKSGVPKEVPALTINRSVARVFRRSCSRRRRSSSARLSSSSPAARKT
jgi:acetyl-CoA C-acetyltransferase